MSGGRPLRVRFAPSPTGHLHVGNARTALFNWLLARGRGGTFILRIEDTDVERSTAASERAILDDLRWLGLAWDEGPEVGGPHGPYHQSERLQLYASYARDLLEHDAAYYCFCTPEQLEEERRAAFASGQPPKYSGRCRTLDRATAAYRVERGEAAAIRFRVPDGRHVAFNDLVRGEVVFQTDVIGDPVIVRSDGHPAYNFAVVVDDALMQVTHVVRGEDHISNTPRQILIYEALGLVPPSFAHLALVLGPDHAPLSKRHGATSVAEFRERGVLPEALVNYLALLGWSPGDGEEMLPLDELVRRFDLGRVGHSAAVFDREKLAWLNRQYMRLAPPPRLAREVAPYFARAGYLREVTGESLAYLEALLPMVVGSVDRLEDIVERVAFIFAWDADRAAELCRAEPAAVQVLSAFGREIARDGSLDRERFRAAAARARTAAGVKGRALFHPIRVALTAAESGPELDLAVPAIDLGAALAPASGVAPVVGCAARVAAVLERLGG